MAEEDGGKLNPIDKLKCMSERQFANLLREFWDFSLYHGNMMKIHTNPVTEPHKAHTSNTSLVPTVFSKQAYYNSISIQKIYNMLYHKVATDSDFLRSSLDSVSKHDDFMKRHLDMLERLEKDNITPRIYLALNRNDYMCHHEWSVLKQVEFNTMSSAASGVCRAATKWHRYVTGVLMGLDEQTHIPENKATAMLAQAMVRAWELYDNESAAVVFFCTQSEFNFADQRSLQYDIHKCNPKISVMRVTFEDLFTNMKLDSERRLFIYDREVAIVYYRWGYAPHQYMTEKHWNVRYDIERSLAVKCPSLSYVLAGTKRIQQVLAQPGVIEKWLSAEQCNLIRQTFIGLHSFEPSECGEKSVDLAQNNPSGYVMKPQRDGGGNNSYNEAIVDKLNTLTREELSAYTLMEKIEPPSSENYIVCEEKLPKLKSVLNELGIFGALVACDGEVVMNEGEGFLLRSKDTSVLEGGLMRGSSCLDSPWLV